MAREIINVGAAPNDGTGDPIRTAYIKCNNNFGELYSRAQVNPPNSSVGSVGDEAGMYAYDSNFFYYCFQNYDGSSVIWAQITQTGNAAVQSIVNGTSSVAIPVNNGNISVNVTGTANVGVWSSGGLDMTGAILPSGNALYDLGSADFQWRSLYVSNDSIWLGGTQLTVAPGNVLQVQGANVITAGVSSDDITIGNISGDNGAFSNALSGGNITTTGIVSAAGNITSGGLFIGNGAGLFGVVATANVGSAEKISNGGSELNVVGSGGNIVGNINGSVNLFEFSTVGFSAQGNITAGSIRSNNGISAVGNVTASYFIGNGSQLTGLPPAYSNSNVSGFMAAFGSNTISTTGNITCGNVIATLFTGTANRADYINTAVGGTNNVEYSVPYFQSTSGYQQPSTDSNLTFNPSLDRLTTSYFQATTNFVGSLVGDVTGNLTGTTASVTGSVTGANLFSNSLISTTGNLVGGNLVISATGNISGGNIIISGSANISGNVDSGNLRTSGQVSATGNITGGNLSVNSGTISVGNIVNNNSNGIGNIGTTTTRFNTVFAVATSALYADLAEYYLADAHYEPGTVVKFGGSQEITKADADHDATIAGVVSEKPAYEMNAGLQGEHVTAIALAGRVKCKVRGPITRGQMMVSAGDGHARAEINPNMGSVIGKALQDFTGDVGVIEVVVGRL